MTKFVFLIIMVGIIVNSTNTVFKAQNNQPVPQIPPPTVISLNDLQKIAYNDLISQPVEQQNYIRYLALNGPDKLIPSLIFAFNSVSFRNNLSNPIIIKQENTPLLLRLNLQEFGLDLISRRNRLSRLKDRGVDISFIKELDFWEDLVKEDRYFFTQAINNDKIITRGWLDPGVNEQFRALTVSAKPLLSGYQVLSKILTEPLYSRALLHPPKENDLYKSYLINETLLNTDPQLRKGGSVLDSIVALHNRELQLLPSFYGRNEKFIWRTFDTNVDNTGETSILENFVGTVKYQGREIIGSLPNGLHWYYLSNGAGNQVAVVPQDIAIDQRTDPKLKLKDRSVINAYKCTSCHGPVGGIQPFNDVISRSILKPDVGLGVYKNNNLKEAIEEYYLADLPKAFIDQQTSYNLTVKECNGLTSEQNSNNVNNLIESYNYDLVTPAQAIKELGIPQEEFRAICRKSGSPYLILLASDQPIRRSAFEKAFASALLVKTYPWDSK